MSLQYNEFYNANTGLTVGVNEVLFSEKSAYQKVEIFATDTWGNLMVIDGMVMLSEKDEFVYHEMIAHPAMFTHPEPKKVLIIGGGDGGTAREVLRHRSVEQVDMVEIDETVIRAAKEFLPEVGAWDDPRLNVKVEDGIAFIKNAESTYDVILIDGSDPVGPAEGLFTAEFLELCKNALSTDGVFAAQTESPWVVSYHHSISSVHSSLTEMYPYSGLYLAHIPLYPAGMWCFMTAGKKESSLDPKVVERVREGLSDFGEQLRYYNAEIHTAAFALPNFVDEIIR